MKISVFGLGYVGVVTAACFARNGHEIIGVDVAESKIDLINAGHSPVIEDEIDELIAKAVRGGKLHATNDPVAAVNGTDLAIICVGTPSRPDGGPDQRYVQQVVQQIGSALKGRARPFYVVLRSTVLPGTTRGLIIPTLEKASGMTAGSGFEVAFHPEFLREGTSVRDFYHPPKIVVGERAPGAGAAVLALYDASYACPRIVCALESAEMVKYSDNLFHGVKVTFANEIGQLCHALSVDARQVMDIFCQDTKLNISSTYLRPGFAFGGSCLGKDLRAFLSLAQRELVTLPMLGAVLPSNRHQIERAATQVLELGTRDVGLYGLAFKPGTDDLRESPLVELAEMLLGKGVRLRVYDQCVQVARLVGGNKSYVEQKLPHLAELLVASPEELDACQALVLGHPAPAELVRRWQAAGKRVHDLAGPGNSLGLGSSSRLF
jgi:GDP-mannose 6-dehydrogenase